MSHRFRISQILLYRDGSYDILTFALPTVHMAAMRWKSYRMLLPDILTVAAITVQDILDSFARSAQVTHTFRRLIAPVSASEFCSRR